DDIDSHAGRSFIDFAVSNDSNPFNGFSDIHRYEVTEFDSQRQQFLLGDFPKLGWNADAYVISLNMFATSGTSDELSDFDRVQIVTIDKQSVLDRNGATMIAVRGIDRPHDRFDHFTLVPARMHDAAMGGPMWFVEENPVDTTTHFDGTHLQLEEMVTI